ncbi:HlyD family efflux transporter periplasmic adaptor subunit [Asticcacaulis sp. AND118]|uniref:HlyD family secretion protein n=1 Tax=Asticcacaulis sp. AND118 TaxID=2840468 RepID=UPI001D000F19|nr:HlyD family efflux transporter periplasmic adaptor subunit [Asticcacaulis sp. AND118]UDF05177.1 HlyD family efflux transporter periplasmic adaptor subunit [Asticcacaulis sp. AND118]
MSDTENAPVTPAQTSSAQNYSTKPNDRRRQLLTGLAAVVAVGVIGYGAYYLLVGSHYVSTDNAYVGAETAQVNALVAGPVARILVNETQTVKAGDVLMVIDDADAKINVAAAQAALATAERRVMGYYANDKALGGQMGAREADIARAEAGIKAAEAEVNRTKFEFERRKNLATTGAVSQEEVITTESAYASAVANLTAARAARIQATAALASAEGNRQTNATLIAGVQPGENPEVMAARARLASAELALERTVVRAPMAGVVTRKAVQIGQQVQMGTPLMAVVPISQAYVDANFKEVQLKKVQPGQEVELTSDLYGEGVKYKGKVVGVSGGTGSAFSLIPAQNASGNWIKVVQRLPVRIQIDEKDLKAHPLRVGLSMKAKIDVSK